MALGDRMFSVVSNERFNAYVTSNIQHIQSCKIEAARVTARAISFICICLSISGCAGIGSITPTDRHEYFNSKIFSPTIALTYNQESNSRTVDHSYNGGGSDKAYSKDEVLRAWGTPDKVASDGHHIVWTYNERTPVWGGIVLHALFTVPLAIPIGKEKHILYFNEDRLEKVLHHASSTKLFVCDPLYMLAGGMAAGMSPTGKGSVPGLCSIIERKGIYFHYLMNY